MAGPQEPQPDPQSEASQNAAADELATLINLYDPDNVRAMQPVLGHTSMRTSERHYIQADAIKASRQRQAHIVTKRRAITRRRSRKK